METRTRRRIDSKILREAGLALMRDNGKPLTKIPSRGRAMCYRMRNGETVRIRTCNFHKLRVFADKPTLDARLSIEGTDWLLIVMPEVERKPGKIVAFLIPTREADRAMRERHEAWHASGPGSTGDDRSWVLPFNVLHSNTAAEDDDGSKWDEYRLDGFATSEQFLSAADKYSNVWGIQAEVEMARRRISNAAVVAPEAVKISIDFGT